MKFQLKNVQANPFRNIACYPINRQKVEDLKTSIATTEFWDNVVARKTPDGKAEIAYGHHRLVALRETYPGTHEIDLIVRPLTDAKMIQMMAAENNETYGTNIHVLLEAIRATVKAYADGKITEKDGMAQPKLSTGDTTLGTVTEDRVRQAPSFIRNGLRSADLHYANHGYTAGTLASFLGMANEAGQAKRNVNTALVALELIELGYIKESDLTGLSSTQVYDLVTGIQQKVKEEEKRRAKEAQDAQERAAKAERKG